MICNPAEPPRIACPVRSRAVYSSMAVQEVTDGQVRPAAQKVADNAEPAADQANKQIMEGAKLVAEKVTLLSFAQ